MWYIYYITYGFFMKKILIYLLPSNKRYAVLFNDENEILDIEDVIDDVDPDKMITNGVIKGTEDIFERWEVQSAKIKNVRKTRNSWKVTIDVDFKLLLRKFMKETKEDRDKKK